MTDTPAIPEVYQSDYLFLLVGKNPLPDYVAATLLLNPGGQLYLVHSTATKPAAERLARHLTDQEKDQIPKYVPVGEADSTDIRSKIDSELSSLGHGQIGLNYTGGTKLMSVYACRTLLDYRDRAAKQRSVTLSYLDARTDCMYIEHNDDPLFVSESLLHVMDPSPNMHDPPSMLKTVVELHTNGLVSKIERTPQLPDLARLLAQEHQKPEVAKAWRSWCNEVLRQSTRKSDRWDRENVLCKVHLDLPSDRNLERIVGGMRTALRLEQQTTTISLARVAKDAGFKKAKHFCEWLDGKWLEYHVLDILQTLAKDRLHGKIHDPGMGVKPANESEGSEYEVDIGVMQGYRLYAISCTTGDDKSLYKLKLFEAYERARNMGGDEARVGLICLNHDPRALERQVSRSWDAEGKVRVFGRSDIANLTDPLADWFISADS
ncbi:MAG: hypothetical protein KDI55_25645 [Anaerolineae bacterium]|nr:hypothetical protein [Anaerolineae bacterium]